MNADDAKSRDATITRLMVLSISAVDHLDGAPMLLAIAEQMNDALDKCSPSDEIHDEARLVVLELILAAKHLAGALAHLEVLTPLLEEAGAANAPS